MPTVTITATIPQPPLQVTSTDIVIFRGWYTNSFIASDGVTLVEGGNGQDGFFYEETCSLNGSGFVVVPALSVQPTTGSNPAAGFFGQLFINGVPSQMIFGWPQTTAGWQIPASPTTTTFGLLALYNAASQLLFPPNTYPTFNQVVQLISQLAGSQQFANVGLAGITELDTAPNDPSHPIAIGANNPSIGNLRGTLTPSTVPRASTSMTLGDGLATDDGTDWGVQTLNYVQLGDYQNLANGSYIDVNDTFGRADIFAGSDSTAQYAGLAALCGAGSAQVFVQSTGQTHLYGASLITTLGDAQDDGNSTQVLIDDPNRMVVQSAVNAVPTDAQIANERVCFYLDQTAGSLKARIRLSDGTYATWEGAYTPD